MKKILFVVDSKNWTLGNIAKQLKDNLSNEFDIDIVTLKMFDDCVIKTLILSKHYDLTHFFWRGQLGWLNDDYSRGYVELLGLNYDEFIKEYVDNNVITTSICDHLFLTEDEINNTRYILSNVKDYIVVSKRLKDIYSKIDGIKKPNTIIHDGVDLNRFKLKKHNNDEFIIGWAGNSKFTDSENDDDLKGVNKIIKPAIKELINEGYKIKLNVADKVTNFIPFEKMPEYYNTLDLYICASKTEGTPAPVLEAMASGVPVISTDVGVVPEVFGKEQSKLILINRTKDELKSKIIEIMNNKKLQKDISNENIDSVQKYDWSYISKQYKKFFEKNIK